LLTTLPVRRGLFDPFRREEDRPMPIRNESDAEHQIDAETTLETIKR
jgi:hypothetical protein